MILQANLLVGDHNQLLERPVSNTPFSRRTGDPPEALNEAEPKFGLPPRLPSTILCSPGIMLAPQALDIINGRVLMM